MYQEKHVRKYFHNISLTFIDPYLLFKAELEAMTYKVANAVKEVICLYL